MAKSHKEDNRSYESDVVELVKRVQEDKLRQAQAGQAMERAREAIKKKRRFVPIHTGSGEKPRPCF